MWLVVSLIRTVTVSLDAGNSRINQFGGDKLDE